MSVADARETIYRLIRESRGDKVGRMSVYSAFLRAHRDADAEQSAALVRALGEIIESDSGEMLIAGAWLAGAIAADEIRSDFLDQAVRRRLVNEEAVADQLSGPDLHALEALRDADAAIAAAS